MKLENELPEPHAATMRPTLKHVAVSGRDDEVSVVGPTVISASSVAAYYGSFKAVRDVDLEIHKGEITTLIGPSGCGKQAARVSDRTEKMFSNPSDERTENYVTGRFG
ncbi:MAG TPA: hypothetical protein VM282_25365 [Acidimicrobiales bacterium]|nr:hypothetical protein [Acidimicrobiales bacterium]